MSKIKVIMCPVDREPYVTWIENRLRNLQDIVGGCIEVCTGTEILAICNEEGMIRGMPFNPSVRGLFGPVILCGRSGEDFSSIPESLCERMLHAATDRYNNNWLHDFEHPSKIWEELA